jgi:hypothetical protein
MIALVIRDTKPYPSAYAARNFHGTMLRYARNFLQRLRASVYLRYQTGARGVNRTRGGCFADS